MWCVCVCVNKCSLEESGCLSNSQLFDDDDDDVTSSYLAAAAALAGIFLSLVAADQLYSFVCYSVM